MLDDGHIEIKDRSMDIVISGGENIAAIEAEGVLFPHPSVLQATVVVRPMRRGAKTSTGKVQKYVLRDRAKALG